MWFSSEERLTCWWGSEASPEEQHLSTAWIGIKEPGFSLPQYQSLATGYATFWTFLIKLAPLLRRGSRERSRVSGNSAPILSYRIFWWSLIYHFFLWWVVPLESNLKKNCLALDPENCLLIFFNINISFLKMESFSVKEKDRKKKEKKRDGVLPEIYHPWWKTNSFLPYY